MIPSSRNIQVSNLPFWFLILHNDRVAEIFVRCRISARWRVRRSRAPKFICRSFRTPNRCFAIQNFNYLGNFANHRKCCFNRSLKCSCARTVMHLIPSHSSSVMSWKEMYNKCKAALPLSSVVSRVFSLARTKLGEDS